MSQILKDIDLHMTVNRTLSSSDNKENVTDSALGNDDDINTNRTEDDLLEQQQISNDDEIDNTKDTNDLLEQQHLKTDEEIEKTQESNKREESIGKQKFTKSGEKENTNDTERTEDDSMDQQYDNTNEDKSKSRVQQ